MVIASIFGTLFGVYIGFKLGRATQPSKRTRDVGDDYAVMVRNYLRGEKFAKDRRHLEAIASQIRKRGQLSIWD